MTSESDHMLMVLPKVDPTSSDTVSGKCRCGVMHGAARDQKAIEERHRAHLRELGLTDELDDQQTPENVEPIEAPVDPDTLGEHHGNEREV